MRLVELLGDLADDDRARSVGQALELVQVLAQIRARPSPFAWGADQERPVDRGMNLQQVLRDRGLRLLHGVEAAGRGVGYREVPDHRRDRDIPCHTVMHAPRPE